MIALGEKMEIELTENGSEAIGVVDLDRLSVAGDAQAVAL
jgi:hypothetical protein